MREPTFANLDCSIARTFVMVRDAWSFLILRDALGGIRQFEDFRLRLGIARNVLTERLKHLVEFELLEKVDIGKRGLRFEYVPTGKAKELQVALMSLMQWGDRWASGRGNPPLPCQKNSLFAGVIQFGPTSFCASYSSTFSHLLRATKKAN